MSDPAAPTAYDAVAYPTALFPQTAPDRMATVATLAGLSPPPIATARVLELAAGDGMNLIGLAAAWPDAEFVGFDLAASAVARGRAVIEAAGLSNIRLEVLDLLDADQAFDGTFDYIIAHGLYAWVPPEVRDATMAMIGRLLSPDGVAYVSYNALPGGYYRMALRDALLFAVSEAASDDERLDLARENLQLLALPAEDETTAQSALRYAAEASLRTAPSVLFHDELGPHYHPQSLSDVVAAATAQGLRFLGDAALGCLSHAFVSDGWTIADDPEAQVIQLRQAEDYREVRFFRSTLLVRDAARPRRRLDDAAIARLYATCDCERLDETNFRGSRGDFEIDDGALAAALGTLIDAAPKRVSVAELPIGAAQRCALFELFDAGYLGLHTTPEPFATIAGARPCGSPLARVLAAAEASTIAALDHGLLPLGATERAVLIALDGTRDRGDLATVVGDPAALEAALAGLARKAMLLRQGRP